MKAKYIIIAIILSILILASCEKVIDLDLKDTKQQIVVEAQVNNGLGNNYVILSKSGSYYDNNDFEMIKNADVEVSDKNGNTFLFKETQDGVYHNKNLDGNLLETYTLNITNKNQTITSRSTMPQLVPLDSITTEVIEGGGPMGGGGKNNSYKLFCHFKDPANEDNYYKFRITTLPRFSEDDAYTTSFILNDDMFDGKTARIPIRGVRAMTGDTLFVQLFSMDRANYEYFKILEDTKMSVFSTSIGNPVSNIEGTDVIGVFGANAVDVDTLIVK